MYPEILIEMETNEVSISIPDLEQFNQLENTYKLVLKNVV